MQPDWKSWARRLALASVNLLRHGPCSDPDCCESAIKNAKAQERLRRALQKFSTECNVPIKTDKK